MRDILFRGIWVHGNKEWIEGDLVRDSEGKPHIVDNKYAVYLGGESIFVCEDECEVIPETVGQYTGLTDKNGKKIFEGDIVEGHCHSQWSHRLQRCVVEYDRGNFEARHYVEQGGVMRYYSYKVLFSKDVVVIGNIHDNPELLKGGAE